MEENRPDTPEINLGWALCFEVGLGLIALLVGRTLNVWPAKLLHWPLAWRDLPIGLLSALPPLVVMLGLRGTPLKSVRELYELVDSTVMPIFRNLSWGQLALISVAAGWGEELLFRGFVQAGLTAWLDPASAIFLASLLFGLLHFVSPAYFVMALFISTYLGLLFWYFQSLWVPIVAHAGYDFLMLAFLRSRRQPETPDQ